MGNPFKGDVAFKVDDAPYIFSLRTNALCQIQADFGTGYEPDGQRRFLMRLQSCVSTFSDLRTVVFHALQEHHQDTIKTKEAAGDLMDRLGRPETIGLIGDALEWAFPPARKDEGEEGAGAGPKESPPGTGADSS